MSMNKLWGLVVFAALGAGALAGCGGMENGSASGSEPASVEQGLMYCTSDSQCTNGYKCIDSACRAAPDDAITCGNITCSSTEICCVYNWTCQTKCPFP